MRYAIMAGTILLAAGAPRTPVQRYRVDIQDLSTIDDGTSPVVDTNFVAAFVTLAVTDSAGLTVATFVIDSASFRHTSGPDRSDFLNPDLAAGGTSARITLTGGRQVGAPKLSYGGYPPGRSVPLLLATFRYFFAPLRATVKTGDAWTDSTAIAGATAVSRWSIGAVTDGVFSVKSFETTAASARGPEGEQANTSDTTRREFASSRAGPIVWATIRRESHGSGSDAMAPGGLTFSRTTATTIAQLP